MCTDEGDIVELNEMYRPLCWQGCENDHGGFKKLVWYGIMKEFNCKATSTWSKCGRAREKVFTHSSNLVKKGKKEKHSLIILSAQGDIHLQR